MAVDLSIDLPNILNITGLCPVYIYEKNLINTTIMSMYLASLIV